MPRQERIAHDPPQLGADLIEAVARSNLEPRNHLAPV